MKISDLVIHPVVLSEFAVNSYVANIQGRSECVIIDPGMEPDDLVSYINQAQLLPQAILITHGHWDHIGGIKILRRHWVNVPIYIGVNDRSKLTSPEGNLSAYFGYPQTTDDADFELEEGDTVEVAGFSFKVLEIPGHSVGHVVYLQETEDSPVVFCGDAIFFHSVGRTDFPDGSPLDLLRNLKEKILTLPEKTYLLPGHGSVTSVQEEKNANPYL